jgi:arylsulfatase A-like enzyme
MLRLVLFSIFLLCVPLHAKPNIIVILADDLGWADLACMGSTFHKTPNLDRLAAQGIRHTRAYAACPVCSPTRAALMTGKVPARLGITDWLPGRADRPDHKLSRPPLAMQLALDELTLAEALKEQGYATAHIGKWHLGGEGYGPTKQGFDVNIAGDEAGTPRSYFAPYTNKTRTLPGLEKAPEGEYLTDRLAEEAEKFIEANKSKPFFLYLPHFAVHTPMRAKKDLIAKYPAKAVPGKQSNAIYAAMLESLDDAVGRVMKKLDDAKLSDNTIIVFTSDNGGLATLEGPGTPATINSPLREGKGWLYEGGIRVPMIVRWPGKIAPKQVSAVPVISHDLFPTLVTAAGGKVAEKLDGVNLLDLWQGKGKLARDTLAWHYPHYANQGSRPGGAIIEGSTKLIECYHTNRRELYQIDTDVSELRNLAADKPEVVERLAKKLDDWRKATGAKMPTLNPDYTPNPQDKAGKVTMHARTAVVHGTTLRYEPLPHKATLGFWSRPEDFATWECTISKPGSFDVNLLVGCANGNGGSEVEVTIGKETLSFKVTETGGWQAFQDRTIGKVKLAEAGRIEVKVKPKNKAKAAVMDLREIRLVPSKP